MDRTRRSCALPLENNELTRSLLSMLADSWHAWASISVLSSLVAKMSEHFARVRVAIDKIHE